MFTRTHTVRDETSLTHVCNNFLLLSTQTRNPSKTYVIFITYTYIHYNVFSCSIKLVELGRICVSCEQTVGSLDFNKSFPTDNMLPSTWQKQICSCDSLNFIERTRTYHVYCFFSNHFMRVNN